MNNLGWFIDRIGKKVYRDKDICSCEHCQLNKINGVKIIDLDHAQYLFDMQNEMGVKYFDKK